jgi:TonB-dependent receptor
LSIKNTIKTSAKVALLNAACLGFMSVPALAQDAGEEVVVVTGFRAALASSTNAKRESTNFTDSVFAEDIGQFPDLNIAESLNRVPGVTIEREVNGEGLRIAIRGLNTNFAKVLLNGSQIAVASSGAFDNQGVNREVDLDLFPTELFTRLDVAKSPTASILEGGLSGTVNMRTARPFDNPGQHLTYVAQSSYASIGENWSPRGALIGSWTNEQETFGVLVGAQVVNNRITTSGYETIGYTTAGLTDAQCGSPSNIDHDNNPDTAARNVCTLIGGNGYRVSDTVPVNAGAILGVADGAVVDQALLEQLNPGTTALQIGEAMAPRLGRPAYFEGNRDRVASVVSLQWRPADGVEVYLDMMGALGTRDINRRDLMLEVRGFGAGNIVPQNWVVDANNVLESGDFVNGNFFLEARPYDEDLEFYNLNPGGRFQLADDLVVEVQANLSRSVMLREQPTVGFVSPRGAGVVVNYDNTGGDVPTISSDQFDINDPAAGWQYTRVLLQSEKRVTNTQGMHWDVTWGDELNNLKFGVAYDEIGRVVFGLGNGEWGNTTCGNPCVGGAGSSIPAADIDQYLFQGEGGFVDVDYGRFFADSNYESFASTATITNGAATGATSGLVDEETIGAYVEANGETEWRDHLIRLNAGFRWVETDQTIASLAPDGNGVLGFNNSQSATYDAFLPSLNVVGELTDDITMRFSASRTLSRQNPNQMLPFTTFSDPGAQFASRGNPNLTPFISNSVDFGGEWYTGGEGYVGVTLFTKEIQGFPISGVVTVPFSDLGIDIADITFDTQLNNLIARGGLDALIDVTQLVNANGNLTLNGYELTWVQPLDFALEGLGFTVNYTRVNQTSEGVGAPANATGVPRYTYNLVAYYETGPFSGRFSYNYQDQSIQNQLSSANDGFTSGPNSPGNRFDEARGQLDAAFRYTLEALPSSPQLTLDWINITEEPRRAFQGFENATYTFYDPGYSVLLGIRGTF